MEQGVSQNDILNCYSGFMLLLVAIFIVLMFFVPFVQRSYDFENFIVCN